MVLNCSMLIVSPDVRIVGAHRAHVPVGETAGRCGKRAPMPAAILGRQDQQVRARARPANSSSWWMWGRGQVDCAPPGASTANSANSDRIRTNRDVVAGR